jgi:hypothetical protein
MARVYHCVVYAGFTALISLALCLPSYGQASPSSPPPNTPLLTKARAAYFDAQSDALVGDSMAAFAAERSALKAEKLLQEVAMAYQEVHSLSGTLFQRQTLIKRFSQRSAVTTHTLALQRQDVLSLNLLSEPKTEDKMTSLPMEVSVWGRNYRGDEEKSPTPSQVLLREPSSLLVTLFYFPEEIPQLDFLKQMIQRQEGKTSTSRRYGGRKILDGVMYEIVTVNFTPLFSPGVRLVFYIGPDRLISRLTWITCTSKTDEVIPDFQVKKPLPAEDIPVAPSPWQKESEGISLLRFR